jgi:disulfide oxidoreductase YuzD
MARRFGEGASVAYYDVTSDEVATAHSDVLDKIRDDGLMYPVTVIDGVPLYDGAVSYPAILRAVSQRLEAQTTS